jgi:His/Glu/Gln/Arg/opine family amino acid ABC transporter permease subunit
MGRDLSLPPALLQRLADDHCLSAAALVCSTLAGLCSALAQGSRFLPLRYLGKIYVELVRGTPLLVQILILFYVVADAFGVKTAIWWAS